MRSLWILFSFLLAMVAGKEVTDTFTDEAVETRRNICTCSFSLVADGENCSEESLGTCNEECLGFVKELKLTGKSGIGYDMKLQIKKGQVNIKKCQVSSSSNTAEEDVINIPQTWSQEPNGYNRTALIQIPESTSGQKFPVVIHLHGSGGKGSLKTFGRILKSVAVLVAPSGYENQWNVNADRSKSNTKAPDVEFILELIRVVGETVPSADMDDVTLVGGSMGGSMIQRLLIEVPSPQPFKRVIPLYGMLNTDQYHDGQFWMSSDEDTLPYDVPVEPANPGPQFIYFHGDADTVVTYWGGPGIASNNFLGAQNAIYTWATYWGETGPQLADEEGTVLDSGMVKYSYLDDKAVHYKLPGAGHSLGEYQDTIKEMIKDMVQHG